jgi:hypothetical protein
VKKLYRERIKNRKVRRQTIQVRNSLALPAKAATVAAYQKSLNAIFRALFSDEHFVTLLEAESLADLPGYLGPLFEELRNEHEIG